MAKLAAIGDSLTHGFQSLAINKVELSYAAMIAEALGVPVPEFRIPSFLGKGGFPLNIEWIARNLETYGDRIWTHEWPFALNDVIEMLDDVEDYWETGKGSKAGRTAINRGVIGTTY